jgi:hypothetical protein
MSEITGVYWCRLLESGCEITGDQGLLDLGAGLAGIRMNGKTTFLFRDVSGLGSATQHVQ